MATHEQIFGLSEAICDISEYIRQLLSVVADKMPANGVLESYVETVGKLLDHDQQHHILVPDTRGGLIMSRAGARALLMLDRQMEEAVEACKAQGIGVDDV